MRRIFSTTLLAMGLAGLLHAAENASTATPPASTAAATPSPAVAQSASAPPPAAAPAQPAASAPAVQDSSRAAAGTPKPDSTHAKPVPAKKLSKKAKAAADSAARADSLRAAVSADSLKAAQVRAADSAQAAARASAVADSLRADSARQAEARARAADSSRAAAADTASADTAAAAKPRKRKRVVRETTVNTLDELKGRYRSPKKALFMSLIVPGLGQAYVGHSWFNYTRGAAYFMADMALAYGWHYYVGVKQDRQIAKYKRFADENWRQWKYEDSVETYKDKSKELNLRRDSYCEAVQSRDSEKGRLLFAGCLDPAKSSEYQSFQDEYRDTGTAEEVGRMRAGFPSALQFYELIGKENEFITGWLDAPAMKMDTAWYTVDENGDVVLKGTQKVLATTPDQQRYIAMRDQANDYARMQAWFLGGMVINHIVSALDAALTARYHNKALYQTETSWYDRVHLDSRIAWDGLAPSPTVTASFTF